MNGDSAQTNMYATVTHQLSSNSESVLCFTYPVALFTQVRYIHEAFSRVRPGVTLLALHGAMKQTKRVKTYDEFCRKQFVVLFATDLAARGLGKNVCMR